MILPAEQARCLAYDVSHPVRKKLPEWCARRDTCARALALRSDPPTATGRVIKYRVCAVGQEDAHIDVDHWATEGSAE
jgi:hypothetical protein